ncbi:SDR family NAD(P)-dependent oxidoreductase [Mycolicibacterium sp. YH-1]|uniref:SDR family NAD(P)-dependent oxidoreductase n=1 Tax=Mycolicibacterium sp. YH-1 TaxID=2908837 RepID=UPI001F4C4F0A|nr:SDR family NAD(P)-dependent oxidoreductase [Mycolicibacterium sp. YH-1]UNB50805.1 SDR family NAD(P)-dependent oxidoreductase [Mycolicibacterium sp. YH-1]
MTTFQRVALVTGAAQGIGKAIAESLAIRGATVALADIDVEKASQVSESIANDGGKARAYHVDVADQASVTELVDAVTRDFGSIDALVNNGGLDAQPGRALEIDGAHWNRLIDIDLTGQWWCTQAVLPGMVEREYGRIIYVSSSSVYIGGQNISPAYCAAKSGLIGLTVALATQMEQHNILVNCLMPGPTGNTGTPMDPSDVPAYLHNHPLGFGGPQPLVDATHYLLDSSGDWVSGAILNVSGGRLRGR